MWAANGIEEGTGLGGVIKDVTGQRGIMTQITLHKNLLFLAKLGHHIAWFCDAGIYIQI